jgi:hypothetical protein
MDKIKILFLAANPLGTSPLGLDEEIRAITQKLQAAECRDAIQLISCWAVRPDDLVQALLQHQPHIVHFSGHGSPSQQIILVDEARRPKPVSKAALVSLFRNLQDNIRVVVLNACFSQPQAAAIAQTIDCVVGMSRAIGDRAAIKFAAGFYGAFGFGRSVQEAFNLGKTALMLEGIPEEDTPRLVHRRKVNPSQVHVLDVRSGPTGKAAKVSGLGARSQDRGGKTDRLFLLNTLARLTSADLELLVTAMDAWGHVSRSAPIQVQAAEFLAFAEGPTGPGLEEVERVARSVIPNFRGARHH